MKSRSQDNISAPVSVQGQVAALIGLVVELDGVASQISVEKDSRMVKAKLVERSMRVDDHAVVLCLIVWHVAQALISAANLAFKPAQRTPVAHGWLKAREEAVQRVKVLLNKAGFARFHGCAFLGLVVLVLLWLALHLANNKAMGRGFVVVVFSQATLSVAPRFFAVDVFPATAVAALHDVLLAPHGPHSDARIISIMVDEAALDFGRARFTVKDSLKLLAGEVDVEGVVHGFAPVLVLYG